MTNGSSHRSVPERIEGDGRGAGIAGSSAGTVLLVSEGDRWGSPDHALELIVTLHRSLRDHRFRWLVAGDDDRLLAELDVAAACDLLGPDDVPGRVDVVQREDLSDLRDAVVVVVPGYQTLGREVADAAERAGVPVIGFRRTSGSEGTREWATDPFDVESLAQRVLAVLNEPGTSSRLQTGQR